MTLRELRIPALAFTAALLLTAAHAKVTETIKQSYPLAADGVIYLDNVNGSIKIVAWDKAEVSLEAEKNGKTDDDLKRITMEVDAQPAKLTIKTKYQKNGAFHGGYPNGGVDYTLRVPANATLQKIDSVNSNITVTGVKGAMTLVTVNGAIKAQDAAAASKFETVNGSVDVEYDTMPVTGKIELESVNGSTTITVPKGAGFDLKASSVNGRASCALPITLTKSGGHHLKGHVGTGGPSVELETVNGSLSVETK
ncbi:MAG TPA: DUF4097 family beta strand repeat-containing protein [Candidatus Didemnitutus sp.]|nr:DUF4097 family beta strand repeat-containing protein [Candidatus Didemnitutus sp.]